MKLITYELIRQLDTLITKLFLMDYTDQERKKKQKDSEYQQYLKLKEKYEKTV